MPEFDYLTPEQKVLALAVYKFFRRKYGSLKSFKVDSEIHPEIAWRPTFHFKKSKYEITACEVSEKKIYPEIFRMIHNNITDIPITIHCYAFSSEELCIAPKSQKDFAELQKHGHGLLAVDTTGNVTERAHATPAVFHISDRFKDELFKGTSGNIKNSLVNAFDTYKKDPVSGVKELCDFIEHIVNKAAVESNKKYGTSIKKSYKIHTKCTNMMNEADLNTARASVGTIMGFYARVRNPTHHAPKNSKDAHTKYRLCKENFINGVRYAKDFIDAFKNLGIKI